MPVRFIGILAIGDRLHIAVEKGADFVEDSFANTKSGVEELIGFAERASEEAEHGIHIIVSSSDDDGSADEIINALSELGIGIGVVTADEIKLAAAVYQVEIISAVAVTLAFRRKFNLMRSTKWNWL